MNARKIGITAVTGALLATTASAEYTGAVATTSWVDATDFSGESVSVYVADVYMLSNDSADTLLNVYNWDVFGGPSSYFQSFTGTGWQPNNLGGPFDTEALQVADSFVTIGGFGADGRQVAGAGSGTGLDPNFGGNNVAAPNLNAGWYNGSPPSLNGAVMTYDSGFTGTFIGRFASTEEFTASGSLSVTWNQGLGTPGVQGDFTVWIVPSPGAIALLAVAGGVGTRKRRA